MGAAAIVAVAAIFAASLDSDRILNAMQGQLDEMKAAFAVDRAYVLYANKWENDPIAPGAMAKIWVKNYGKTPAIDRIPPQAVFKYSWDGFHQPQWKADRPELVGPDGLLPPSFIIATDEEFGPVAASLDATAEQIDLAKRGKGTIFFEFLIGYDDVRGVLHKTGICLFWDFTSNGFYLCPQKGANYHT